MTGIVTASRFGGRNTISSLPIRAAVRGAASMCYSPPSAAECGRLRARDGNDSGIPMSLTELSPTTRVDVLGSGHRSRATYRFPRHHGATLPKLTRVRWSASKALRRDGRQPWNYRNTASRCATGTADVVVVKDWPWEYEPAVGDTFTRHDQACVDYLQRQRLGTGAARRTPTSDYIDHRAPALSQHEHRGRTRNQCASSTRRCRRPDWT